jgi:hypothetical protein
LASDALKSRILARTLESPFPFYGVGGTVYADDACRDLCFEELDFNFSPSVVKCAFNLLSVGKRCQDNGMDFVWLGSRKMLPYFVCKDGAAVVMRVDYNIPYLDSAGKRGVQPRGRMSKQVRLPLPPSRPGVYTTCSATAAVGITTTTHATTSTMTIRVKFRDTATQAEFVPALAAQEVAARGSASGRVSTTTMRPAQVAGEQGPAADSVSGTASGAGRAVDGAGGGAAFIFKFG